MRGGHVVDLLPIYRDGTLTDEQRERIKTHTIFCLACRHAFDEVVTTDLEPTNSRTKKFKRIPFPVYGAIVAFVLLFVGAVIKFVSQNSPKSVPPKVNLIRPVAAPSNPSLLQPVQTSATPPIAPTKPKPAVPSVQGPFVELHGDTSRIHEPMTAVIDQPLEWTEFWQKYAGEEGTPPEVDFKGSDILAIFSSLKPTKGYLVQIDNIEKSTWEGNPARIVHYRIIPPTGPTTPSSSHPYLIVKVPKLEGNTFFRLHP